MVPRALLNRAKVKPSTAKSAPTAASNVSKAAESRATLPTTSNSTIPGSSAMAPGPVQPTSIGAEDLVSLAALPDLYNPGIPNNYYENVYKPRLARLAAMSTEMESSTGETTSQSQPSHAPLNVGEKMLFKQGWKGIGYGLGKDDQGMAAPLVSVIDSAPGASRATGTIQVAELQSTASRAIVLLNMASRGSADEALAQETKEDCSVFGSVLSCVASESPDPSCSEHDCVRIFVVFSALEVAQRARASLDRKKFDGRSVRAVFYPESAIEANQLWLPLKVK